MPVPTSEKMGFINSKKVIGYARGSAAKIVKYPHRLSDLVIRKKKNAYFLACYVCPLLHRDMAKNQLRRPSHWILLDFVTGKLLRIYESVDKEFSDADYDAYYSSVLPDDLDIDLSDEAFRTIYGKLDTVRLSMIDEGIFPANVYEDYLACITKVTPPDYQRFLLELSDVEGKCIW